MTLSVIIITYNRSNSLKRILGEFTKQIDVDKKSFEVVIVDDGSDVTAKRINELESEVNFLYLN